MVIIFEIKENSNTSFRHLYSSLYPLRIFMTRGEWIRLQQRFLWLLLSPLIVIFNQSQYNKLYISLKKTPTDLRNFNKTYLVPFKLLYWILVSYLFMKRRFLHLSCRHSSRGRNGLQYYCKNILIDFRAYVGKTCLYWSLSIFKPFFFTFNTRLLISKRSRIFNFLLLRIWWKTFLT